MYFRKSHAEHERNRQSWAANVTADNSDYNSFYAFCENDCSIDYGKQNTLLNVAKCLKPTILIGKSYQNAECKMDAKN